MLDPSRLLRLVSSKAATGICVAALATGAGTVGVMAAVGGSGPAPQTASSTTTTTTTTTTSSHATTSKGDKDQNESSETETSETHTKTTQTHAETSESETESSETGDHDAHGDAVRQGVIDCKAAAAKSGHHGIGHCVSPIARSNDSGHNH